MAGTIWQSSCISPAAGSSNMVKYKERDIPYLPKRFYCRKGIPNSLRKHRKARGLLQKEVARILRIKNASMISRWENGLCVPKPENMFRLGVLYRVMVDALFIDFRKSFEKDILRAEQEVLQNKPEGQNGP